MCVRVAISNVHILYIKMGIDKMPNFKKFGKANNFYFPYKIKKELKS